MPDLHLQLGLPGRVLWPEVAEAFGAVAVVFGAVGPWETTGLEPSPDRNPSPQPLCRAQRWTRPGAVLSILVRNTEHGNPRDGWGYEALVALEVPGRLRCELMERGWSPGFGRLEGVLRDATRDDHLLLRRTLAEALPGLTDRSDHPSVVLRNIAACGDDHAAIEGFLRDAEDLASDPGLGRLLRLRREHMGPSAEALRRRLRLAPQDILAWREAAEDPPRGVGRGRIARVLGRLQPWSPAATERRIAALRPGERPAVRAAFGAVYGHPLWRPIAGEAEAWPATEPRSWWHLDHGLGPRREDNAWGECLAALLWPALGRRYLPTCHAPELTRQRVAGVKAWRSRRGLHTAASLVVRGRSERVRWWWWCGEGPDDLLVMVDLRLGGERGGRTLGAEATAFGSAAFVAQARAALEALPFPPCRLVDCEPGHIARVTEPALLVLPDLPPRELAREVMRRLDFAPEVALHALTSCACPQGYPLCEHRAAVLVEQRRWTRSELPRAVAMETVLSALDRRSDVRHKARMALEHAAVAAVVASKGG